MADEPADYWGWVAEGRFDHEWRVYDEHLKPEHTFIDIGAWIGSHSLYAATVAKIVYAAEADPVAFKILDENAKRNPSLKIMRGYGAIADHRGEVTIGSGCLGASTTRKNLAAAGGIGAAVAEHTITVPCETLREFASMDDPLFIKIDIEGMEEEVFKDAAFFHERKPSLLVEFHPWWWANEAETRKDFHRIAEGYKNVMNPATGLYFLEN